MNLRTELFGSFPGARFIKKWIARSAIHRLNIIKSAPLRKLRDPDFLEEVIAKLGLCADDRATLEEFPKHLWRYCNKGLRVLQYPNQLRRFLIEVSKHRIETYLEIGVAYGGTLILVTEFLKRFNPLVRGIGIDPCPISDLLKEYMRENDSVEYIQDFSNHLKDHIDFRSTFFDLVFIDGDHDEKVCWNDFQLVKDNSRIVAFHDIVADNLLGVRRTWNNIKATYEKEYDFKEFIDQYEEVLQRRGERFDGMGMMIER